MLDDLFYLKESRKFGALFKVGGGLRRAAMSILHQPMACIVGIKPARRLFAEHDAALRSPIVSYNRYIPRGFLRYMNDADHKTYRPIFQSAFAEASPLSADLVAAEQIRLGLDQLVVECERAPSRGIQPFAAIHRLTLSLLLRFLFDIDRGNEHYNRLVDLYRVIDLPIEERAQYGEFKLIVDEITNILREQVSCIKTLRQLNAGATPCVLEAILREHPSAIDDATVWGNLMFLARNSSSDLAGLWHWMLKMLGDQPVCGWSGLPRLRAKTRRAVSPTALCWKH